MLQKKQDTNFVIDTEKVKLNCNINDNFAFLKTKNHCNYWFISENLVKDVEDFPISRQKTSTC